MGRDVRHETNAPTLMKDTRTRRTVLDATTTTLLYTPQFAFLTTMILLYHLSSIVVSHPRPRPGPYSQAKRFVLAAKHLDIASPFSSKDLKEEELGKVRAWSLARYERSTNARSSLSVVGGRSLEYFKVFKAGNNNIRYSIDGMADAEIRSLQGGNNVAATNVAGFAAIGDSSTDEPEVEFDEGSGNTKELGASAITAARVTPLGSGSTVGSTEPCTFTFLRDPLERFASAYAEFEYRSSKQFTSLFPPDECETVDWATTFFEPGQLSVREFIEANAWPPKIGTKERQGRLSTHTIVLYLSALTHIFYR